MPDPNQHGCAGAGPAALDEAATEGSLIARFREVAAAHEGCLAVQDARSRLTYGELRARADGVGAAIADGGREPVVLLFRQGVPSVVATLGALAAGRPYAPLEPSDPPERIVALAGRLGARRALTDDASGAPAQALRAAGCAVDEVGSAPPGVTPPHVVATRPDDLACVYFTSGSTGEPKGVMDSHRNVMHNAMRYTVALGIGPGDRLGMLQPPSLSAVVSSTFAALLNGAALFPIDLSGGRVGALADEVRRRRITIYHSVPSIFRSLVAVGGGTFPDVRVVRLEGDRASAGDVALHRRHFAPSSILANGLGTTETGLCRQLRLGSGDPVPDGLLPVGHAVTGVAVEVVGDDGRPVPFGEAGEIAVTGRHLALGYWGRPDLTAEVFSADPADPGLRTYRTGDTGRLLPDGCLAYLGRRDGGLKVLGRRVEPAEVEAHLLEIPGVCEAAVTTYPGRRGEGRLAAHLVVDGTGPDHLGIREALVARLPAAMVPATIVFADALPLTAAGKLDRAALAPARAPGSAGARGPREEMVAGIWRDVLEHGDFGMDDDFLAVGGDSLAAAEVLAALEERLGRPVPPSLLVRASTVAALARELDEDAPAVPSAGLVPLQPRGEGAPLVLVHGLDFSTNTYAWLVRALGAERPVWGLDAPEGAPPEVARRAAGHAAALRAARPGGPHLLAGFCSGAIVALEVARALRAAGEDVPLVALIGVGAIDFPGLVAPAATARWRTHAPATPRLRALAGRLRGDGAERVRRALARHDPAPLPGDAVLYLSAEATSPYSDDPVSDWAGLAERVRVEVLPGPNPDLLAEPVVADLAARIRWAAAAVTPPGR